MKRKNNYGYLNALRVTGARLLIALTMTAATACTDDDRTDMDGNESGRLIPLTTILTNVDGSLNGRSVSRASDTPAPQFPHVLKTAFTAAEYFHIDFPLSGKISTVAARLDDGSSNWELYRVPEGDPCGTPQTDKGIVSAYVDNEAPSPVVARYRSPEAIAAVKSSADVINTESNTPLANAAGIILATTDNAYTCYDVLAATADAGIPGENTLGSSLTIEGTGKDKRAKATFQMLHVHQMVDLTIDAQTFDKDAGTGTKPIPAYTIKLTTQGAMPDSPTENKAYNTLIATTTGTDGNAATGGALIPADATDPSKATSRGTLLVPDGMTLTQIEITLKDGRTVTFDKQPGSTTDALSAPMQANHRLPVHIKIRDRRIELSFEDNLGIGHWDPIALLPGGADCSVSTAEELAQFAAAVNAYDGKGDDAATDAMKYKGVLAAKAKVIQLADIDLAGLKNTEFDKLADKWIPIGTSETNCFRGAYNGNGYTLANLHLNQVDATAYPYQGLFGYVMASDPNLTIITGVHLRGVEINGNADYTGSLAGYATTNAIISLCTATGTLQMSNTGKEFRAGGLIGENRGGHITRCTAGVTVSLTGIPTGSTGYAGGLCGKQSSLIASCQATGSITATRKGGGCYAGGLSGNNIGTITCCYANGNISVTGSGTNIVAGGIVGANSSQLRGSYATGNVTITGRKSTGSYDYYQAGGIVGKDLSIAVQQCYATGTTTILQNDNILKGSGTGAGNSELTAADGNIVYNAVPGADDIYNVVKNADAINNVKTTHYSSAYTITPVTVSWSALAAWDDKIPYFPTLKIKDYGNN